MKWTARELARTLYWNVFNGKHLVVVPNCHWPGAECDLLVVLRDLRLVDVEIKISRSDLKIDAAKDKWFDMGPWRYGPEHSARERTRRDHPDKIWKHYYALPDEIWKPELASAISPASGILLIRSAPSRPWLRVERQAKPNREARAVSAEALCDIARLQSVRMWSAFDEVDTHRHERVQHPQTSEGKT